MNNEEINDETVSSFKQEDYQQIEPLISASSRDGWDRVTRIRLKI